MSAEIHLSAVKVLFYAGMLTIAMIIDRGHGLDLDKLIVGLQNESELITRHTDACCDPASLLPDSSVINNPAASRSQRSCPTDLHLPADRCLVGHRNSPLS